MAGTTDDFPGQSEASVIAPSKRWADLTPHDSTNFSFVPKSIKVGATAGSFVAVGDDGVEATFYANAGEVVSMRPIRINSTGMTAGMTFVGFK